MKKIYFLIGIYLLSLVLTIYGAIIDTDPITSFPRLVFEVFVLSLIVFGILALPFVIIYHLFQFFKKITKSKLVD